MPGNDKNSLLEMKLYTRNDWRPTLQNPYRFSLILTAANNSDKTTDQNNLYIYLHHILSTIETYTIYSYTGLLFL